MPDSSKAHPSSIELRHSRRHDYLHHRQVSAYNRQWNQNIAKCTDVANKRLHAIDNTTILRAAAFKEFCSHLGLALAPSSFLTKSSVRQRSNLVSTGWSDWGMDVRVVDNPQPGYEAESALYALPSIGIVAPVEDIFGDNGIYTRSSSRGQTGSVPHPSTHLPGWAQRLSGGRWYSDTRQLQS